MTLHRHLYECTSTNDIARQWASDASDPAPEWAVVTADFQTVGRGRRGRSWHSAPGDSLLMSVVVRPPYPVSQSWRLGFVAAVAVAQALDAFGVSTTLKWPNDVLVDGLKVSGILVETVVDSVSARDRVGERAEFSGSGWVGIIGIGVNVNQSGFADYGGTKPTCDSPDVRATEATTRAGIAFEWEPTSLSMARGEPVAPDAVGCAIRRCLHAVETINRTVGFSAVAAAWRSKMDVGISIRRGDERGIQTLLLDDGAIRVRFRDGTFGDWRALDGEETRNGV